MWGNIIQHFIRYQSVYFYALFSRFIIYLTGFNSRLIVIKDQFGSATDYSLWSLLNHWDSDWYKKIINDGYFYDPENVSAVAFFPLYPLLIKGLHYIMSIDQAGFLLSNTLFFTSCIFLFKITEKLYSSDIAKKAVILLCFFPTSYYFSALYTESLFLCLSLLSFWFLLEGKFLWACFMGLLIAQTRLAGLFILIPLGVEYFNISYEKLLLPDLKKINWDILALSLPLLGLGSYMIYLKINFGDFLAFAHSSKGWHREITLFTQTLKNVRHFPAFFKYMFLFFTSASALVLVIGLIHKVKLSFMLYALGLYLLYISSGSLESIPRYLSVVFPLYISLAVFAKNEYLFKSIKYTSLSLLVLYTILYTNNYWMT